MSNYSYIENDLLLYIVSFYDTKDYKFLAPLLKQEFGNIRSENAYISRLYKLHKMIHIYKNRNQVEEYSKLQISNVLLNKILKPDDSDINYKMNLIKAEYASYKLDVNERFNKIKHELSLAKYELEQKNKRIEELEELLENKVDVDIELPDEQEMTILDDDDEIENTAQSIANTAWFNAMSTPIENKDYTVTIDDNLSEIFI